MIYYNYPVNDFKKYNVKVKVFQRGFGIEFLKSLNFELHFIIYPNCCRTVEVYFYTKLCSKKYASLQLV